MGSVKGRFFKHWCDSNNLEFIRTKPAARDKLIKQGTEEKISIRRCFKRRGRGRLEVTAKELDLAVSSLVKQS